MANTDRYRRDEQYGREDRGFVDRATDEVRSWFGDDDADVRRRRDEREQPGGAWHAGPDRGTDRGTDRGRAWADRSDYDDRRNQRVLPELVDARPGRGGEGHGARGWDQGDDWGGGRRRSWPEDRGDTTLWHGQRGWDGGDGRAMGGSPGGWHVGKGPSGYTRSDERIREDVCDRLTDDPYLDATHIEVAVQGGEVTLSGMVDRREDKRRAEDVSERISGVREVSNRLRVGSSVGGALSSGSDTSTSVTRS